MPASSSERRLAAQVGVNTRWARTTDRTAATAPARAGLDARFLAEADGDPIRAANLRQAHFARLALKSARARRRAKELISEAKAAEAELAAGGGA